MKIGIIVSEFNNDVTSRMLEVAKEKAAKMNLEIVQVCKVPGAYDMPVVADAMLRSGRMDGVATLGAIIKGQTKHDEVIAQSTLASLQNISVAHGKPISLGITGPGMHERQAYARIRPAAERAIVALVKIQGEINKTR